MADSGTKSPGPAARRWAACPVGPGLVGLAAGREHRVRRSADLAEWHEAARITVPADPWPESGRDNRIWSEAAVLPGRRFYRLEWEEP